MNDHGLVCVGGPCDGQRVSVPHNCRVVRIPVISPLTPVCLDEPISPYATEFSSADYRRMPFAAGDLVIDVLVPVDASPAWVLTRLIDGYTAERGPTAESRRVVPDSVPDYEWGEPEVDAMLAEVEARRRAEEP